MLKLIFKLDTGSIIKIALLIWVGQFKMIDNKNNCSICPEDCSKKLVYKLDAGLSLENIKKISQIKQEPEWMLDFRLKAYESFLDQKLPKWGPNLEKLDFNNICFYLKPLEKQEDSWSNLPENINSSFDNLGIKETEDQFFSGLGAQYESEVIYHKIKEDLEKQGVIFCDTDTALKKYPEIFKKYFSTVVPYQDNKFAALNSACWSGGSFIYVPENIQVELPLQAYYRIDSKKLGQFERTLIIADKNSSISYIEGCSAQNYSEYSLHSAVVEIIALEGARVNYYTIQNWSKNIYNLVTKRAVAYKNSIVNWIDCNIGSFITMKYPAVILKETGAKADIISLSVAGDKQIQDTGAKAIHLAPNTSSKIVSKSLTSDSGYSSFRGLVKILGQANNSKSFVQCDGLLLDELSFSDAYPVIDVQDKESLVSHEATISTIGQDQVFYLQSRGLSELESKSLIINGFISPLTSQLPPEYSLEINRLINIK